MDRVSVCSLLSLLIFTGACTSSTTSVTSPTSVRCAVNLTPAPPTVGAAGGSGEITIAVSRECTWDARSEADWITLASPASGQGEATLRYTASANAVVTPRRGSIAVNDQRVELTQAAAACTFALSSSGGSVEASGGALGVTVTAQASCLWTAVSQAEWISVTNGREGNGQGAVGLRIEANPGAPRQGSVIVAGQPFVVAQGAVAVSPTPPTTPTPPPTAPPPANPTPPTPPPANPTPTPPTPTPPTPPAPPTCTFDVSPTSESFSARGGDREVRVRASGSSCSWSAASSTSWIAVTGGGNGNGQVRYSVAPNDGAARTGGLTVAGVTVTVAQEAARVEPIELDGRISNLNGFCPNLTFELDRRLVRTNQATAIDRCDRLRDRRHVHVTGLAQPDGSILALRVSRDDDDDGQ